MSRQPWTPSHVLEERSSLVSRLSIAILSSMLLGMTTGDGLSESMQSDAGMLALLGILFCWGRMLVARRSLYAFFTTNRRRRERRLEALIGKLRDSPVAARARLAFLSTS